MCNEHAALSRLAAKAQGYDAAVADNEARMRVGAMMANACFNLAQREHLRPNERQTLDDLRRAWDSLGANPGTALLAQHRKEVANAPLAALDDAAAIAEGLAKEADRFDPEEYAPIAKAYRVVRDRILALKGPAQ